MVCSRNLARQGQRSQERYCSWYVGGRKMSFRKICLSNYVILAINHGYRHVDCAHVCKYYLP